MAAITQKPVPPGGDVACPDPSAHQASAHAAKLQDSASKAALLAHSQSQSQSQATDSRSISPLGPDGKISSASAAASLKHAKPHELPSFPSVGIDTVSSGEKAATLAHSNQKPFEHWKPELSASASKAALLATSNGGKLNLWQPTASEAGASAAGSALGKQKTLSPQLDYGYTALGSENARKAATMSVSHSHRRSTSTETAPLPQYPDSHNSVFNALNAASVVHSSSMRRKVEKEPLGESDKFGTAAFDAARVQNLQTTPAMFSERPPVALEVEEKRHNDALRASAVSFARQMYDVQQQKSEESTRAGLAALARSSQRSIGDDDLRQQAVNYINLQEEAQRLANDRLAKLDPDGVLAYREHYGYGQEQQKRNRLSMRGNKKDRNSEDQDSDEDEEHAGRIRRRQNKLSDDIVSVDDKRTKDRADLLAAAQKLVQARMMTMDEKVFQETGKASPAMMEEWEAKAKAKAAADSEGRMANHGKVHIGGGKYMDQAEIDAIAQGRMQPHLDEIHDTAEKQRARDEEVRLDQERRKAEEARDKEREKETKAEVQRQKNDEKQKSNDEKQRLKSERDAQKQSEKQRKAEEKEKKRQAKEDKKASKGSKGGIMGFFTGAAAGAGTGAAAVATGTASGAAGATGAAGSAVGTGADDTTTVADDAAPRIEDNIPRINDDDDTIPKVAETSPPAQPIVEDPEPLQGSRVTPTTAIADPDVEDDAEPSTLTTTADDEDEVTKPTATDLDTTPAPAVPDPEPTKPEEIADITNPDPAPIAPVVPASAHPTAPNLEETKKSVEAPRSSIDSKSARNRLQKSKGSGGEHVADRALPLEREWQAQRFSTDVERSAVIDATADKTTISDPAPIGLPATSAETADAPKSETAAARPGVRESRRRSFFSKLVKRSDKSEKTGKSGKASKTGTPAATTTAAAAAATPAAAAETATGATDTEVVDAAKDEEPIAEDEAVSPVVDDVPETKAAAADSELTNAKEETAADATSTAADVDNAKPAVNGETTDGQDKLAIPPVARQSVLSEGSNRASISRFQEEL